MKKIIIIIFLMATVFMLTACQVTPETPIVVQKDTERLIKQAANVEQGTKLSNMTAPTENYVYSATGANGKLRIDADVSVSIPNAGNMPIFRVSDSGFSQEMVTSIFNYLYPNEKPMNHAQHTVTKAELEETLLGLKKKLADGSYDKEFYSEEDWQRKIDETEAWYQSAPETSDNAQPTVADGTMTLVEFEKSVYHELHCYNPETLGDSLLIRSYMAYDNDFSSSLRYCKPASINYSMEGAIQADGSSVPAEVADKLTIGYDEAKALCEGFFAAAGKKGVYQVRNVAYMPDKSGKYALQFIYTRVIDSIPTTLIAFQDFFGAADNYASPWGYEYLGFIVDGAGIVEVIWTNPIAVSELVQEDAGMLTFEEITPIFEKMIKTIWEPRVDWNGTAADPQELDISVNHVGLELCRIREQNIAGKQGVFVPAWIFYGHITRTTTIGSGQYYSYDEVGGGGSSIIGAPIPLLVINAIDGSIIDIGKGY